MKHAVTPGFIAAVGLFLLTPSLASAELIVWHAYRGGEKAAFEKVIEMYNAQQADASTMAKPLAVPYDAYADKITAAIPRGKGPDVYIFAQDRLGGWVEAGQTVESVDFFVDDELLDSLLPGMIDAMTYRDTIYGIPLNYKSITMIYNPEVVEDPPATVRDLITVAKQNTNVASGNFGLAYEYSNYFFHAALMNAFGGQVFAPGPEPVIDSDENISSIKEMLRWYKTEGVLPDDPSAALIASLFNSGKAPIVFSGPWFLGEIEEDVPYSLAPLPTVEAAGGAPMRPWLTIEGVYISPQSQDIDQAYEFARFLVSEEAASVLALEGGQLPTNQAVYAQSEVANNETLAAFRAQLENAVPMPNYAEMTLMWSPVTTAMNKIVKGSASPEAALAEAQKKVEKDIDVLRTSR
ncbi:MAG: extracellular solute-binding protein [Gammaproteobacteria bacterium]|nr:extracellular solute-binding protein [Gammaproteobacteria bacterium]